MRARADYRGLCIRTIPAREGIADGILAYRKSGVVAAGFHPCASLQIGGSEHDSRNDRGLSFRNQGQRFNLGEQPIAVDRKTHECKAAKGWRFQFL